MRTPEVIDLHPVGSVTAVSHSPCLAVSHNLKYLLTCPAPLVPAIWKVADLRFSLRSLRGHKSPVTAAAFAKNDQVECGSGPKRTEFLTCSKDKVMLWNLGKLLDIQISQLGGEEPAGIVVAREMGDITTCSLVHTWDDSTGWISYGVRSQAWVLRLNYSSKKKGLLRDVERAATIECHTTNISDITFNLTLNIIITAGEDRAVKLWALDSSKPGTYIESLKQGRFPINCLSLNKDNLLAVGDCSGTIYFYSMTGKGTKLVTKVDVGQFFTSDEENEDQNAGCDIIAIELRDTVYDEDTGDTLPSLVDNGSVLNDILNINQRVVFASNLGIGVFDLRSRGKIQVTPFSTVSQSSVFSSMASTLAMSCMSAKVLCLYQSAVDKGIKCVTIPLDEHADERRVENDNDNLNLVISLEDENGNDDHKTLSVIPKDNIQKGSALDLGTRLDKNSEMSKQSLSIIRKGSIPLDQMKQNIRLWQTSNPPKNVKSSGYGKEQPRGKMFEPQINKPKVKKNSLFFATSRMDDPDLDASVSVKSEPDLTFGRKKWSFDKKSPKMNERRARWSLDSKEPRWTNTCQILRKTSPPYPVVPYPPSKQICKMRIWDESAKSQLAFMPSGKSLAISGAHNSIQILPGNVLLNEALEKNDSPVNTGQRLVGHTAAVNSLEFSRTGDWLATGGDDMVVKIWDWRSRRVIMDVNSRRGGFYEEGYGVVRKVSKEAPVFNDGVNKSRFFYMDNILLSASGNKLMIHSLKLPPKPGDPGQFRLAKNFTIPECKTINTLSCVNQFFSFITFLACSDKSVKVLDVNQCQIVREFPKCHPRNIFRIVQNEGTVGVSHPERGYDLFITAAMGDGAKLWDLRTSDCVQKFDTIQNVRHQCGVALSPCLRYLAAGGEDGCVYLYDTRRVTGCLERISTGCDVIMDVAFSPRQPHLVAVSLDGVVLSFKS